MKKTYKVIEDIELELVVEMSENYPSALRRLWTWEKDALANGRTKSFQLSEEVFDSTKKQAIFLSDIHAVCSGGEMTGSIICLFIQNCWTLTIANPEAEIVYYKDPVKRRIANGEWVEVVDHAIKMYEEDLNKVAKKKILWENMAGVPVQSGNKDCGMFVMRYMKKIIEDKELEFATNWMRRSNLVYTEDDVQEIRIDFRKIFYEAPCELGSTLWTFSYFELVAK